MADGEEEGVRWGGHLVMEDQFPSVAAPREAGWLLMPSLRRIASLDAELPV
jgi:hypothetical protein